MSEQMWNENERLFDDVRGDEYWRRINILEESVVDPRLERYNKLINAVGKTHSHICGNEEHLTALYRYGFENLEVGKLCDIQTEYDYVKLQRNMAVACWFLSFVGMMIVAHFV